MVFMNRRFTCLLKEEGSFFPVFIFLQCYGLGHSQNTVLFVVAALGSFACFALCVILLRYRFF